MSRGNFGRSGWEVAGFILAMFHEPKKGSGKSGARYRALCNTRENKISKRGMAMTKEQGKSAKGT